MKTLVVVAFFDGGGGVGILLSSFFSRGAWCHSQICFVVAFVFMDTVSSSDGGDLPPLRILSARLSAASRSWVT